MNERIRELAEQAGLKIPADAEYNGHIYRHALEKFAASIVRECVGFLRDTLDDHFAAEQLEEHFEVEE